MNTALLVVSFGTSVPQARGSIHAVEEALQQAAPQAHFSRAFTSPTIRRILAGQGEVVLSLSEALDALQQEGFDEVFVQPTHLLYGIEYDAMKHCVTSYQDRFRRVTLGAPLLSSAADLQTVTTLLSKRYLPVPGEALFLIGHGTKHFANMVYPALQGTFHLLGRDDVILATIEGFPDSDAAHSLFQRGNFHSVHLVPLMLVAGEHTVNDIAGDEDSFRSKFESEGISVRCTLQGLGLLPEIQAIYVKHLRTMLEQSHAL